MEAMTEQEFFYWLQGYFELGGVDTDPAQVRLIAETILRHASLVRARLTRHSTLGEGFVRCEFIAANIANGGPLTLSTLGQHVAAEFLHVIDPQAGGEEEQGKLNAIHSGEVKPAFTPAPVRPTRPGEAPLVRC
jgi:hypothetical protein